MELTDEKFDQLISRAMDELPQEYIRGLNNVAIVMADAPDDVQVQKLKISHDQLLLGLFEGVPQTARTGNEAGLLPDKITLFKYPILAIAGSSETALFEQIKRTLWHEIADYYGLDHARIDHLEGRQHTE